MIETRRCPVCELIKPVDEFPPRRDRPDGRMSRCRPCDAERSRARYAAGKRRSGEAEAALRERNAVRYEADKATALAVYGGSCAWCGETDPDVLEFDHVNDDGGVHRAAESSRAYLARIATSGAPLPDYELRLLCTPCHRGPGWQERRAARGEKVA